MNVKDKKTQFIVKVALLGVIGFLLMALEFPIPFVPPWMKIDISDTAVIVAGYGMGPVAATGVAFIKSLLHFLLKSNDGTIVGDVAAFIISVSISVPACIIYRRNKSKKSMITGLLTGSIIMIIVGAVLNAYVLIPAYSVVFGMPIDGLVAIATKVNPMIKDVKTLIFMGVIPFNVLKCIILAIFTLLVYNRIEKVISIE